MAKYANMVLGFPGQPAVPNEPPIGTLKSEGVVFCPKCSKCQLTLNLAAIWIQLGVMPGQGSGLGSVEWQAPRLYMPIMTTIGSNFDAVRVWRFSETGEEPQVSVSVE